LICWATLLPVVEYPPRLSRLSRSRFPPLVAHDEHAPVRAGPVGQEHDAAGPEVEVEVFLVLLIEGGEGVDDPADLVELKDQVSAVAFGGVERAVARGEIDGAGGVGGGAVAAHPDSPRAAVGGGVEGEYLLQGVGVVADHPPVVRLDDVVAGERDVDDPRERVRAARWF